MHTRTGTTHFINGQKYRVYGSQTRVRGAAEAAAAAAESVHGMGDTRKKEDKVTHAHPRAPHPSRFASSLDSPRVPAEAGKDDDEGHDEANDERDGVGAIEGLRARRLRDGQGRHERGRASDLGGVHGGEWFGRGSRET